jgi:uncharacterized membrane protein
MSARASVVALPAVATGVLLVWHPPDPTDVAELLPVLGRWLTVHAGLLVALPVLLLLTLRLLRGIDSTAATVARVAAVATATFYAAFEGLVGLATGVLVAQADRLSPQLQEGAFALAQSWWEVPTSVAVISTVAILAWVTTFATAAVATHRAGYDRLVVWSLLAAALLFAAGHPGLTGLAAMLALAVALGRHEWHTTRAITNARPTARRKERR